MNDKKKTNLKITDDGSYQLNKNYAWKDERRKEKGNINNDGLDILFLCHFYSL